MYVWHNLCASQRLRTRARVDIRGMWRDVTFFFLAVSDVHGFLNGGVHVVGKMGVWLFKKKIFLASYALLVSCPCVQRYFSFDFDDLSLCANAAATWSTVLT